MKKNKCDHTIGLCEEDFDYGREITILQIQSEQKSDPKELIASFVHCPDCGEKLNEK